MTQSLRTSHTMQQIGNEGPDAPGTRLLSKEGPVATGGRFADRTLASIAGRGSDGHLLLVSPSQVVDEDAYGEYDGAPKPGELSLLDVVRGSFLHAGSHWPVCHRAAVIEVRAAGHPRLALILHHSHFSPLLVATVRPHRRRRGTSASA